MKLSRRKQLVFTILLATVSVGSTVALVDGALIYFNLFPPRYEYGEPELGFAPHMPGRVMEDSCTDNVTGAEVTIVKNELGIRTGVAVSELQAMPDRLKIAVVGDSQTELCAPNPLTHPGVLEKELQRLNPNAVALSYGRGRYSPLQAYLLFKKRLKQLKPQALLINFYTGNDFYDMLRVDDRPYLAKQEGSGAYELREPVWLKYEDPRVQHRSRVMFVLRSVLKETGVRDLFIRLQFLVDLAKEQRQGLGKAISYMNDLRAAVNSDVGYPAAYAAQMLNQQIFFHHFPNSIDESRSRIRFLMDMIRKENPDMLLIMSPIPSYQLVRQQPVDQAFLQTIDRMPFTYEDGLRQEETLYYTLKGVALEMGWLFIDNLVPLRAYKGSGRLFNAFDYHVTPTASAIIGSNEARTLEQHLGHGSEQINGGSGLTLSFRPLIHRSIGLRSREECAHGGRRQTVTKQSGDFLLRARYAADPKKGVASFPNPDRARSCRRNRAAAVPAKPFTDLLSRFRNETWYS